MLRAGFRPDRGMDKAPRVYGAGPSVGPQALGLQQITLNTCIWTMKSQRSVFRNKIQVPALALELVFRGL